MKISEVVLELLTRLHRHDDIDVEITWEGITRKIDLTNIYLSKEGPLYIDADDNQYKDKLAVPDEPNRDRDYGDE